MNEKTRVVFNEETGEERTLAVHDGGVTEEQVKAWKEEHRKVRVIEVEDNGDLFVGWFRKPNMETLSTVSKISKVDEVRAALVMFDYCWLGGDPVVKSDALVKMGAIKQLGAMVSEVTSELKNA